MEPGHDPTRQQRVELILQQVDALPTLAPIATRLLQLSSDDEADLREIVKLVESDPALTGRLLSMCRKADKGVSQPVTTVDRAIVLLGFDAVRSTLLSVHVYDLLGDAPGAQYDAAETGALDSAIDRAGLWRHMIGAACAAEMLAKELNDPGIRPEEAFVCGLLHDLGKIALDVILPRSYARVARLADRRQTNIADVERSIIGVDHHTAGKRLGEHWGLPHAIQDVMWLHNQAYDTLPDLPHKRMIGLVSLADAVTRSLHIGWSGNFTPVSSLEHLGLDCGVEPGIVRNVASGLHQRVSAQAAQLGFDNEPDEQLQVRSIVAANRRLASMNDAMEQRSRACAEHASTLQAIAAFQHASSRGRGLVGAFADVVHSASTVFGQGFYAVVHQARDESPWQVCQFAADGRLLRSQLLEPPQGVRTLRELTDLTELRAGAVGLLPWLEDFLAESRDIREVRILPLVCAGGAPTVLLHDRDLPRSLLRGPAMPALTSVWAGAIAAAGQHEGAKRLGERLAHANRVLSETQARLTENRSMARLGELAAGAAHEMNNPLTIMSGRSQLLRQRLKGTDLGKSAEAIHEATQRLTELITGLHLFADPPPPNLVRTDLTDLLARVVRDLKLERHARELPVTPVTLHMHGAVPPIKVDPAQIGAAAKELLKNAMESSPRGNIELRVQTDDEDDRLMIIVKDDGRGMSEHALAHAFDPFFSEKEAGRQPGLGLAKARRLVELHNGEVELESSPDAGTTARIVLHPVRGEAGEAWTIRAA